MTEAIGPLSIQLWSTRGEDPLDEQFAALAAMGYTDVQPYHDQYDDVPALKAALDKAGLTAVSGHFNLSMFEGDAKLVIDAARQLGMQLVVAPWLDPEDRPTEAEGWKALHKRLKAMKEVIEGAGLGFAWHNHDFEFQRYADGSYGIEYLLDEDIDFAMDLAWIHVGGEDPGKWLQRYAGRVPAIHVKDVAAPGQNLDQMGFADLGTGVVDWNRLWALAGEAGVPLRVAEHDLPGDWRRFAGTTAAALKVLRGGGQL
ncbi:MAG TPA: sugar phosphate isomerase/epimerase [Novosphingobium sp.]|nr:sugar phosphate isomerase/epimerase [Novosphingobium sp.]HZV08590.1 sugar phosphate isomerase/epimerase [Novosphingobium sp.]